MKKTALTILILILAVNVVSACELSSEKEKFLEQLNGFGNLFLYSSYTLIVPIVIFYFLKKRTGMWTIITALVSLVMFFPILLLAGLADMCGYSAFMICASEFIFMLFLFTFQLFSWISQRKTSIKLR